MLLAVVYPRDAPVERLQLLLNAGDANVGDDFDVACRCKAGRHCIDGASLRTQIWAARPGGHVPVIDVRDVLVSGGSGRLE